MYLADGSPVTILNVHILPKNGDFLVVLEYIIHETMEVVQTIDLSDFENPMLVESLVSQHLFLQHSLS